jgi:hypothetical protein
MIFSTLYWSFRDHFGRDSEDGPLKIEKYTDAIYFAIITHTTVGFGDINGAEDHVGATIASLHALLCLILNFAGLAMVMQDYNDRVMDDTGIAPLRALVVKGNLRKQADDVISHLSSANTDVFRDVNDKYHKSRIQAHLEKRRTQVPLNDDDDDIEPSPQKVESETVATTNANDNDSAKISEVVDDVPKVMEEPEQDNTEEKQQENSSEESEQNNTEDQQQENSEDEVTSKEEGDVDTNNDESNDENSAQENVDDSSEGDNSDAKTEEGNGVTTVTSVNTEKDDMKTKKPCKKNCKKKDKNEQASSHEQKADLEEDNFEDFEG